MPSISTFESIFPKDLGSKLPEILLEVKLFKTTIECNNSSMNDLINEVKTLMVRVLDVKQKLSKPPTLKLHSLSKIIHILII